MTNPRKTGYCAVCEYIKKHKRACINKKLLEGASYRSIAIETGLDQRTIAKHAKAGHGMKPVIAQAGRTMAVKEGLDLLKCHKEVYDLSIKAAKIAIGDENSKNNDVKPDLRSFGSCISGATKVIEVLARISPNENNETESDGYIDAVRANANNDWKEARPVQVATTEPKTEDGSELVDD